MTYTTAVGDAGQRYLDELCRGRDGSFQLGPVWLPGTFLWQELFERMLAAAAPNATPACVGHFRLGAVAMRDAIESAIKRQWPGPAAEIAANTPLAQPEGRAPRPASGFAWYAGNNEEWYACGPHGTRDAAIDDGRATFGPDCRLYVIEARRDSLAISADSVIEHWLENEGQDGFDADHRECERVGAADEIRAADEELQELLTTWLGRWSSTFSQPNIFAGMRNAEVLPALEETAAA